MDGNYGTILNYLRQFYDKSNRPVLCITKKFRLFYANEKMKSAFKELCGKNTVKKFITPESAAAFEKLSGTDCLEMSPVKSSPFGRLFAEPIFDGAEIICYKISFGGSGALGNNANVSVGHINITKVISDSVLKPLSELSDTLVSVKENASMKIFDDLDSMSGIVENITAVSDNLRKAYSRLTMLSSENKTFFRLSETVAYLSAATGDIVLPDGFSEHDNRTVIFSAKGGVSEVLLRCCRYLKIISGQQVKIPVEISYKASKIILKLSAEVGDKEISDPFSAFFTEQGMFNYGLRDARSFIEKQDGNILVLKKSTVLSVLISFPTVDAETLPAGMFDVMEESDFEYLLGEIGEYREMFPGKKKRTAENKNIKKNDKPSS